MWKGRRIVPRFLVSIAALFTFILPAQVLALPPQIRDVCAEEVDKQSREVVFRTRIDWNDAQAGDFYRYDLIALDATGGYYPQWRDRNSGPGKPDRGFVETNSRYPLTLMVAGLTEGAAKAFDKACARSNGVCKLDISEGVTIFPGSYRLTSFDRLPSCSEGSPWFALVIGNGDYTSNLSPLNTAERDAGRVAERLSRLGYNVLFNSNLNRQETIAAFRALQSQVAPGPHKLIVYYAGHGLELIREPILLPLGADTQVGGDVDSYFGQMRTKGVAVKDIVSLLPPPGPAGFNMIMLDMCREGNLIPTGFELTEPEPPAEFRYELPPNVLVTYAVSLGDTYSEPGQLETPGLYAEKFLKALDNPSQELSLFLSEFHEKVSGAQTSSPRLRGGLSLNNRSCIGRCADRE